MTFSPTKNTTVAISETNTKEQRRKYHRFPANWSAQCVLEGVFDCNTIIVDASEGGFGLSTSLPVPVGTMIVITIDQVGVFPCRLAWKNDKRCGVEMLREEGHLSEGQMAGLDRFLTQD